MEGHGNSGVYKNKQRRHFHAKVISVFMGGEKVPDGTMRGEDKGRYKWGGGKARLIVRQLIYEGTGAPGHCQWKDRSSVAIAPSAFVSIVPRLGWGAMGIKVGGGRLE